MLSCCATKNTRFVLIRYLMVCGPECRQRSPATCHTSILYDVTIQFQELLYQDNVSLYNWRHKYQVPWYLNQADCRILHNSMKDRRWCRALHRVIRRRQSEFPEARQGSTQYSYCKLIIPSQMCREIWRCPAGGTGVALALLTNQTPIQELRISNTSFCRTNISPLKSIGQQLLPGHKHCNEGSRQAVLPSETRCSRSLVWCTATVWTVPSAAVTSRSCPSQTAFPPSGTLWGWLLRIFCSRLIKEHKVLKRS